MEVINIYVYDDMGHPVYKRIGSGDKLCLPNELWGKINRNCPDYRDLNNGEELIKNVVKVYKHGNII